MRKALLLNLIMGKTLYFLKNFNNYFNRKIRGYDLIASYLLDVGITGYSQKNDINWNPHDCVSAEIIMNEVEFRPDYLLVTEDGVITSRWFVINTTRTRAGQYKYSLRRDIIFDKIESIKSAPIFVQKGFIQDEEDPFILNDEGMSFNQIKQSETLLKDTTKCAWIACYLAKNAGAESFTIPSDTLIGTYPTLSEVATRVGIEESILDDLLNLDGSESVPAFFSTRLTIDYSYRQYILSTNINKAATLHLSNSLTSIGGTVKGNRTLSGNLISYPGEDYTYNPNSDLGAALINRSSEIISDMGTVTGRGYYLLEDSLNKLKELYSGKIIYYNGACFRMYIEIRETVNETYIRNASASGFPFLVNALNDITTDTVLTDSSAKVNLKGKSIRAFIKMVQESPSDTVPGATFDISSTRNKTQKQEFDLIVIPFGEVKPKGWGNYLDPNIALKAASQIALKGDTYVYDVQLLPYCPLDIFDGEINLTGLTEHVDYEKITSGSYTWTEILTFNPQSPEFRYLTPDNPGETKARIRFDLMSSPQTISVVFTGDIVPDSYTVNDYLVILPGGGTALRVDIIMTSTSEVEYDFEATVTLDFEFNNVDTGLIFYCKEASFQRTIPVSLGLKTSMKVDSNCDFYRIVSPNYQGTFDFNVARNGGSVPFFKAYCTYKPYTPLIKVAPSFAGLYGSMYQDNRGLICAGDFSLPRSSSAWINYQLNNKNYQNIFNREIQNLDFNQSLQMRNQVVGAVVGVASDMVKGATAGALIGGGIGAGVGAVTGGLISSVGAAVDTDTLARQQREERQLAIDKFNYQLGNVKALPYTLTKVGSFDEISKIFPCLEYYSCSEQEREAFINKIVYESMTVMRIDTVENYISSDNTLHYLKGIIIRIEDLSDSTEVFNAIYEEFLKGVYI